MANTPDKKDKLKDSKLPEELSDDDLFSEVDDLYSEMEENESLLEDEEEQNALPPQPQKSTKRPSQPHSELDEAPEIHTKTTFPAEEEEVNPLAPENIPVTLVVELGQIQLTMDQLLHLSPGNLLDVNISPNNSINLTINGKIVAKGELIRVGELIGVRVLKIGA